MTNRLQSWAIAIFGSRYDFSFIYNSVSTHLPLKCLTFCTWIVGITCLDPSGFCTNGFKTPCYSICTHLWNFWIYIHHLYFKAFYFSLHSSHDYTKKGQLNILLFTLLKTNFVLLVSIDSSQDDGWYLDLLQELIPVVFARHDWHNIFRLNTSITNSVNSEMVLYSLGNSAGMRLTFYHV